MKKHFYSHLIETSEISIQLAEMDLSQEERIELINLVDKNIHLIVLDVVLSELNGENKKIFLKNLSENNHDKIWSHLKVQIENIEEKISESVNGLKINLLKDIKNSTR